MRKFLASKWAKVAVFALASWPFLFVVWRTVRQDLTANPVEFYQHQTGDWTLRFLIFTLCITPFRKIFNLPELIRFRRMLGLFAFFYAMLHLATWAWLDKQFDPSEMWKDIMKRWYITVGMAALLGMTPLAITSTAGWVRRMGFKNWQKLHRLVYFCAAAGVIHYYLLVKSDIRLPVMYGAMLTVLLAYRVIKYARSPRRVVPRRAAAPVS